MRVMMIAAILLSFAPAWAQSPQAPTDAAATTAPAEQPAVGNPVSAAAPKSGEKPAAAADDSPIGLFIMPWRNSTAEKDIDRPARLLQGDMSPIDQVVFDRQTEYFDVLEAHAKKTGGAIKP